MLADRSIELEGILILLLEGNVQLKQVRRVFHSLRILSGGLSR
jgi:hypothetical protein